MSSYINTLYIMQWHLWKHDRIPNYGNKMTIAYIYIHLFVLLLYSYAQGKMEYNRLTYWLSPTKCLCTLYRGWQVDRQSCWWLVGLKATITNILSNDGDKSQGWHILFNCGTKTTIISVCTMYIIDRDRPSGSHIEISRFREVLRFA